VLLKVLVTVDFIFLITPEDSLVVAKTTKEANVDMMLKFIEVESLVNMFKLGLILFGMRMMMVLSIKKDLQDGMLVLTLMILNKYPRFIKKFMKQLDLIQIELKKKENM
jgi:hypothetical protein